jgi:hypothetical protein
MIRHGVAMEVYERSTSGLRAVYEQHGDLEPVRGLLGHAPLEAD